jgi:uncharacterized protein YeaO (DUF488 family)
MSIRIVRLGTPRHRDEGVRIGTVRRPPRGVKKERHAADNWYDVWLPNLAPSAPLVSKALAAESDADWKKFARSYEAEMGRPENRRVIETLAALSRTANFSVGCYCEDPARCHRSILAQILKKHGADVTAFS